MTIDMPDSEAPPAYGSKNTSGPEFRYVYYRVYTPDGAIPSKSAFDSNDPFVGRIAARSVPPPHNVASLKRCFVNAEKLSDPASSRTVLYLDAGASKPMPEAKKVTILGPALNGSTPKIAFALVFIEDLTGEERATVDATKIRQRRENNPDYLYYNLFTRVGEDPSKVSFNPNEPALGRIEKNHVSPPHMPEAIKRCIAKTEGKPIYAYGELYQDIAADTAMANGYRVAVIPDDSFGSTVDKPMVLVQPERREGLYNRPIKVVSTRPEKPQDSWKFLTPAIGTILYTDGLPDPDNNGEYKCCNSSGTSARQYIPPANVAFLDE
ncbi:hypothetical protein C8R44DRAFT_822348 [Mycena epipterygia]|nr:hypothetical protein C8R44DRAFT_822348 [Mycena epipterygia]